MMSDSLEWSYSHTFSGFNLVEGIGACWILRPTNWIAPELIAVFSEIEKALSSRLYYLAIAVALSIPDICACLEDEPGKVWAKETKYISWCEKNIDCLKELTGKDLYHLRGGVVHSGTFDHPKLRFDRVIFICEDSPIKAHDIILTVNDVMIGGYSSHELGVYGHLLLLEPEKFCRGIISCAKYWFINNQTSNVSKNLRALVRYRSYGLPPFMVGVPVIT